MKSMAGDLHTMLTDIGMGTNVPDLPGFEAHARATRATSFSEFDAAVFRALLPGSPAGLSPFGDRPLPVSKAASSPAAGAVVEIVNGPGTADRVLVPGPASTVLNVEASALKERAVSNQPGRALAIGPMALDEIGRPSVLSRPIDRAGGNSTSGASTAAPVLCAHCGVNEGEHDLLCPWHLFCGGCAAVMMQLNFDQMPTLLGHKTPVLLERTPLPPTSLVTLFRGQRRDRQTVLIQEKKTSALLTELSDKVRCTVPNCRHREIHYVEMVKTACRKAIANLPSPGASTTSAASVVTAAQVRLTNASKHGRGSFTKKMNQTVRTHVRDLAKGSTAPSSSCSTLGASSSSTPPSALGAPAPTAAAQPWELCLRRTHDGQLGSLGGGRTAQDVYYDGGQWLQTRPVDPTTLAVMARCECGEPRFRSTVTTPGLRFGEVVTGCNSATINGRTGVAHRCTRPRFEDYAHPPEGFGQRVVDGHYASIGKSPAPRLLEVRPTAHVDLTLSNEAAPEGLVYIDLGAEVLVVSRHDLVGLGPGDDACDGFIVAKNLSTDALKQKALYHIHKFHTRPSIKVYACALSVGRGRARCLDDSPTLSTAAAPRRAPPLTR